MSPFHIYIDGPTPVFVHCEPVQCTENGCTSNAMQAPGKVARFAGIEVEISSLITSLLAPKFGLFPSVVHRELCDVTGYILTTNSTIRG